MPTNTIACCRLAKDTVVFNLPMSMTSRGSGSLTNSSGAGKASYYHYYEAVVVATRMLRLLRLGFKSLPTLSF